MDKPIFLVSNRQKSNSHFQTFYSKPKWWSQPKKLAGPGSLKAVQQARGEIGICGESIPDPRGNWGEFPQTTIQRVCENYRDGYFKSKQIKQEPERVFHISGFSFLICMGPR